MNAYQVQHGALPPVNAKLGRVREKRSNLMFGEAGGTGWRAGTLSRVIIILKMTRGFNVNPRMTARDFNFAIDSLENSRGKRFRALSKIIGVLQLVVFLLLGIREGELDKPSTYLLLDCGTVCKIKSVCVNNN